jgi:hypothetical protein
MTTMPTAHYMNIIVSKYPEFIESALMDMLIGPIEYQKNKYQLVLDELTLRLTDRLAWEDKVFEAEQKLAIKSDLSKVHRIDLCYQVHYLKRNFKHINTIFVVEYQVNANKTPELFRVVKHMRTHKWMIRKLTYFSPLFIQGQNLTHLEPIMHEMNAMRLQLHLL